MIRSRIIAGVLLVALFSSCRTLDSQLIEDKSANLPLPQFDLQMAAEVTSMRIDLVRQTNTHTDADGTGTMTHSTTEKIPYHPLGVYIGEGVFVDIHENISMNVLAILQDKLPPSATLNAKENSWLGERWHLEISPESWKLSKSGILGDEITRFLLSDSTIKIEPSFLSSAQTIQFERDKLYYQPEGVLAKLNYAAIEPIEDGFTEVARWRPTKFRYLTDSTIKIGRNLTVTRYPQRWVFSYAGFLGTYAEYTLEKKPDGYLFYDEHFRGKYIKITGRAIEVYENGKIKMEYTIE
jgi:hypothetical protein